jgi:transposase InsO family protein
MGQGSGPAHRLSFAERLEIQCRVRAGATHAMAATAVGCSAKSVQRLLLKTGGLQCRRRPRSPLRLSLAEREEISLGVLAEYTRECLAIAVDRAFPARRVLAVLQQLVLRHGSPRCLRSDNGPEFIAHRVRRWLAETGIVTAYIEPGKPWQNGVGESFHNRFRDECLDREWFHTPQEARVLIEQYRRQYNETRPHSSLGYRTPAEVGARRAPIPGLSPAHGPEALLAVT